MEGNGKETEVKVARTGKLLEAFVEQVEKILLPKGLAIKANEKIYNDEGVQVAEFDIEIEGKVGSTRFKWLIECRDRPTQGPAPSAWIEQLVGRRDRFGFNKVIAVSTSDFAPGAKEYAEKSGIEIRTVTNEDVGQIKDWFLIDTMTLLRRGGRLDHASLFVSKSEPPDVKDALIRKLKETGANQPILELPGKDQHMTVVAAFQAVINTVDGLYEELMPDGGTKNIRLRVAYPHDDSHFLVETELGKVRITDILFHGELSLAKEEVPLAAVRKYESLSHGEDIATTASFNLELSGKPIEISFHRIAETGETHVLSHAPKIKA